MANLYQPSSDEYKPTEYLYGQMTGLTQLEGKNESPGGGIKRCPRPGSGDDPMRSAAETKQKLA
jgi:hypothetical protein